MITIRATAQNIAQYQRLLASEWGKKFPEEVLTLLWALVSGARLRRESMVGLLDPRTAPFDLEAFQRVVDRISQAAAFIPIAGLGVRPSRYSPPRRLSNAVRVANRLSCYLTLSAHCSLAGDREFLADIQALAFQAAVHFVLPEIRIKHPAEHAILLHAGALFAVGYAARDQAHFAYMLSAIHGYLGHDEQRLRALLASFRFTSPRDHSYLTKAQEYWSEYLDASSSELMVCTSWPPV